MTVDSPPSISAKRHNPFKSRNPYASYGHKMNKYYNQRYSLFSRFDDGILMDEECWYSVTPEEIAKHIAQRCLKSFRKDECFVIVDGFCGAGGNLIQFAVNSPHVRTIGCDINPERIRMAKHNSKIYGVQHRCDFIVGDFMSLIHMFKNEKIDLVFLSPPWGGIDYTATEKYSLSSMKPNGFEVVQLCRQKITNNIAFLLPRNVDLKEISKRLLSKRYSQFECEYNMIGTKVKTITAYFGALVKPDENDDQDPNSDDNITVDDDEEDQDDQELSMSSGGEKHETDSFYQENFTGLKHNNNTDEGETSD